MKQVKLTVIANVPDDVSDSDTANSVDNVLYEGFAYDTDWTFEVSW